MRKTGTGVAVNQSVLYKTIVYLHWYGFRVNLIVFNKAIGSEAWVLKKREEQRLEAAQMKFLRHLLGITKLDKEKTNVLGKKQEQSI